MKKILFIVLFIPIAVTANFYSGTITFINGTTKTGLIEPPPFSGYQEILFKVDFEKTSEIYSINDIQKFEILNRNKLRILFTTATLAEFKAFKTDIIIIGEKKSWVRVIKDGKLKLYASFEEFMPIIGVEPLYLDVNSTTKFYLKKPNEDFALYFFLTKGSGIKLIDYSGFKKLIQLHFDKECPKLVANYNKADFEKYGIIQIVNLYEKICSGD